MTIKKEFTEEEIIMVENRDLSQVQMKEYIQKKYSESNQFTKLAKEATDSLIKKYEENKKPLLDLIALFDKKMQLTEVNGKIQFNYKMENDELECLAMKIPALCVSIQEFINDKVLDSKMATILAENKKRANLSYIIGGAGTERLEIAKQYAQYEELVATIKKSIVDELESLIERADKLYEGVKKVLDVRKTEIEVNKRYSNSRIA